MKDKTITTLFFLIVIQFSLLAQEPLVMSSVIEADSTSKDDIYIAVYDWIAENFVSAKDVIQINDKEAGLIVCKGVIEYYPGYMLSSYEGDVSFILKIYIKDNKFKVETSEFNHKGRGFSFGVLTTDEEYPGNGAYIKSKKKCWKEIRQKCITLSENVFSSMKETVNKEHSDDWDF